MIVRIRDCASRLAAMLAVLGSACAAHAGETTPRSPSEALAAFVLADPTLAIELVAAEPEVTSPVAIAWDEDARLYVAEMIDYPSAPVSGRIRRLEDRDGDGRYEHAVVFAVGLPLPNSVLPWMGGLLVTAAPDIWYLRDRNGDGRADERHVVLTGFGEGNPQLRVNGLAVGLDNFIYAANGRSDGDVRIPGDPPDKAVSIRRRDVRFRMAPWNGRAGSAPSASDVQAIAGFSQFGLPHDDWGNRFPSWNTVPIRHVVLEQEWLDRNPYLAETSSVASILDLGDGGRIFAISPAQARFNRESVAYFNASCGPVIERGGLLSDAYRGNAFVCEPLTNLVHRRVLEVSGVTFVARRAEQDREFLASADPCFRPVNLATGPDGALYVVDMYRELVEHPQFVPEPARGSVDFRKWHDRGRIWRIGPKALAAGRARKPSLSGADAPALVALLGHRNGWWRSTAQRLLVERFGAGANAGTESAAIVALLAGVVKDEASPQARLHALYTLAGLDRVDSAMVTRLAQDADPALREHALRVALAVERRLRKPALPTPLLVGLARDAAIRVRLHAALALGARCREEPAALAALAEVAARDAGDPWMRLAILSGLADTALSFIALGESIPASPGKTALITQAAAIVGVRRRMPELKTILGMIVARLKPQEGGQREAGISIDSLTMLAGLADGLEHSGAPLQSLVASPPAELKGEFERLEPLWAGAAALAASDGPLARKLVALDVLARGRPDLAGTVVPGLLGSTQAGVVQTATARAVARSGSPALAVQAVKRWSDLTLATRRELLAALAGSPRLAEVLVDALERELIAPVELDAAARAALERAPDEALRVRAHKILSQYTPPQRAAVIARYQGALQRAGDVARGAAVFAQNCQTCHQNQGRGYKVGPDLSGIAGRAPEALLSDIIDPNHEVASDYAVVSVATRAGRSVSGLLAEETASSVKLRRAQGIEETILRSEIEELRMTGQSLMPEGLEQVIDMQAMADLIAFLRGGSFAATGRKTRAVER